MKSLDFDVVIVGGGHAGIESAHAAARLGTKVAMVTLRADRIGYLSCNPAVGGLAKGQLVKEIDALGGVMGRLADRAGIQFRQLNTSKGPAVRASRAQCDKVLYPQFAQSLLRSVNGLTIIEDEADDLITQANEVGGVILRSGVRLTSRAVVITSGTFLRAVMFTGEHAEVGGRAGDHAASRLSEKILSLGFRLRRLKTGTPPRLHRASIDYLKMTRQDGDTSPLSFSFYHPVHERFPVQPQVACYITYTNPQTHEIIERNFHRSPMFTGVIKGVGPRYCPSIEDKVKRFRDRERHQIFIEPEGLSLDEMYVNGVSTSLPADVQEEFIRSVAGLENARFLRHGYAVEYDAIDSRQLKLTLESKDVSGLFFAGQVNGTSGYEEAGAQGLVAGINAALLSKGADPFVLERHESYTGVMIDDLTLTGADEPYRMFSSRAEGRLFLREDNADLRLSEKGYRLGLLSEYDYERFLVYREQVERGVRHLQSVYLNPTPEFNTRLSEKGLAPIQDRVSGAALIRRPEVSLRTLEELMDGMAECHEDLSTLPPRAREQVETYVKYEGYIRRENELYEAVRKNEALRIPADLDYSKVHGLSTEVLTKLKETRPLSLGQMGRISGVTPAAVANMLLYLRSNKRGVVVPEERLSS